MYNIAVCEDEELILKDTQERCIEYLGADNVKITPFSDGESLLASEELFDLILLDIELSDMTGIDVMNAFELRCFGTYIAFLTSYDTYVKEAYGRNVIGYLNKPLQKEDLERIIGKLKRLQKETLVGLEDNGEEKVISSDRIIYICSDDKYTQVMTDEGCFLQRKTLTYWENILPQTNFSRVNRSCIINLRYYKKEGSYVVLGEKKRVKIGRIYKNQLEKNYREYLWTLARMM